MRLTTFTDYSLRVLMYLAAAPGNRATISEVAAAFDVSQHHLVKVVHRLGKEGVLRNTRGRGGGMELARPAAEINVGRVVRLTERGDVPAECFDPETDTCVLSGSCRLAGVLAESVEQFYRTLERYSLADLQGPKPKLAALVMHAPRAQGARG